MTKSTTEKKIGFKLDADGMVDLTDMLFEGLPIYDEMVKFDKIESLEEQIIKLKECKKTLDTWNPEDDLKISEGWGKDTIDELNKIIRNSLFERKHTALRNIKSRLLFKTNINGIQKEYHIKYFHTYDFNKRKIKKFLSNIKEVGWEIKYFEYLIKESKNFILDLETPNIDKELGWQFEYLGSGKGDVYRELIRSNTSVIKDIFYDGSSESVNACRNAMDEVIQENIYEIKLNLKKWKNEIKYLRKLLKKRTTTQKGNEIDKPQKTKEEKINDSIESGNKIEKIEDLANKLRNVLRKKNKKGIKNKQALLALQQKDRYVIAKKLLMENYSDLTEEQFRKSKESLKRYLKENMLQNYI